MTTNLETDALVEIEHLATLAGRGKYLARLQTLEIDVAYAEHMPWRVLWLPEERVLVLNRSIPASSLPLEIFAVLIKSDDEEGAP